MEAGGLTVSHDEWRLAMAFSRKIGETLSDEELAEVRREQARRPDNHQTCATHDYCDAGQVMIDAAREVFPTRRIELGGATLQLFNASWEIAKDHGFSPEKLALAQGVIANRG